jgi:hypothetical protein
LNTKFTLLVITGSLLVAAPFLPAQTINPNTNSLPLVQTVKYQAALNRDRSRGERALLPPGLKEKLRLTGEQRAGLQPIEDDFAKTSREYQAANQPRIDAAWEAIRQADASKDTTQIQAAHHQLQQEWAGLQRYRADSVGQIRPLLTPDQIAILDAPKNQWRENHGAEANDPSSN